MRLPPIVLVFAAGAVTLGISQTLAPTAHAQAIPAAPALQVSVQSLHTRQTIRGTEVTGRVANTGRQTLTYPSVVCVFTDAAGTEVGRADGYFLAGPVGPGQSAGFRAIAPAVSVSAKVTLCLREAGHAVTVQLSDSRRTMVR